VFGKVILISLTGGMCKEQWQEKNLPGGQEEVYIAGCLADMKTLHCTAKCNNHIFFSH